MCAIQRVSQNLCEHDDKYDKIKIEIECHLWQGLLNTDNITNNKLMHKTIKILHTMLSNTTS